MVNCSSYCFFLEGPCHGFFYDIEWKVKTVLRPGDTASGARTEEAGTAEMGEEARDEVPRRARVPYPRGVGSLLMHMNNIIPMDTL